MAVSGCFCRGELSGLEELDLVGSEDLVRSRGAPLVLDSRRELVLEDVVSEVALCGRRSGVGGEVEVQHPVSMHVLDGSHVVADLTEEVEGCLLVSLDCRCDGIV